MGSDYTVLMTGSRAYPKTHVVHGLLGQLREHLDPDRRLVVRHGDCWKGPDRMSRQWVERHPDQRLVVQDPMPADWDGLGFAAGMERNSGMVRKGADAALAFFAPCSSSRCRRKGRHWSHGTGDCLDKVIGAGIQFRADFWVPPGTEMIPVPPAWKGL